MIPFQSWLSQITGYCRFVTDEVSLRRAWIDGDFTQTSVTDFDELYEQIFDDLDSDVCEESLIEWFPDDLIVRDSVSAFLNALRDVNQSIDGSNEPLRHEYLLRSSGWHRVVCAAESVVTLLGGKYRD